MPPNMASPSTASPDSIAARVRHRAHEEAAEYAHGEDRPLVGYVTTLSTYTATTAALVAASRLLHREAPNGLGWSDLALASLATFKLSRLLAKDPVTSPLRAPFTRYGKLTGPSELTDEPRTDGPVRHAIGELLTCPFCISQWVATGFVSGLVFAPRFTRLAAATFGVVSVSDFLQFAYARAEQVTGETGE